MTDFETEYVFCKDNRLVLIVECLFAKASTANSVARLDGRFPAQKLTKTRPKTAQNFNCQNNVIECKSRLISHF